MIRLLLCPLVPCSVMLCVLMPWAFDDLPRCGAAETEADGPIDGGLAARVHWQNDRLVGSPEPPLPYTTEPVFEAITWDRPLYAKAEPGTTNLVVVLQGGEDGKPSRLMRLDETDPSTVTEFLEIDGSLVYGFEFDPDYQENGLLYLFINGPTVEPERTDRISRFRVDNTSARACDPASELALIEWRSMGHDGGELAFGADGLLYIASGDGTSDSDGWLSGQDISNLLGSVLRIDVRNATGATPYKIPADNPFVGLQGARGEVWAFGLRNPWRLWCDQRSGQIWVGNNGQDLWESIHLIRRGENYGWSVYEGSHPFYPQRQRGPAEIVAPTIEHHHTEARSLTGGVVYRGNRLPELDGAYVYGDYSTGRIWGVRHDGDHITWHAELADTALQISGFAIAPSGDLLVVDHGGSLHRVIASAPTQSHEHFPQLLSETDLFESLPNHRLKPGVVPYSVNASAWNDHAVAERYLTVPYEAKIEISGNRGWNLPNGSIVMQTLSLPQGEKFQRIETRLLLRQQNEWAGYSYRWNDQQTDARLVSKSGEDIEVMAADGKPVSWRIPSRSECMSCHSRAVNFVLGLSIPQMNRLHRYGEVEANQLSEWERVGFFEKLPKSRAAVLVDPYDPDQALEARARSYLHVNCSSCHVEAGGGNARMELELNRSLADMQLVSARPQHATFEIRDAMLVAPGQPERSVLVSRVSRRGAGQMPPLYTRAVDETAVSLLRDWIAGLPRNERAFVRSWTIPQLVSALDGLSDTRSVENGKTLYRNLGCIQCHRIAEEGGGAGPDLTAIGKKLTPIQLIESIAEPSAIIAPEYATSLVMTTDGRTLSGRVEYEGAATIRLRSAESFDVPITIRRSEIEQQVPSKLSMMPEDMLNTCSEEEVLDLVAYLLSQIQP